MIRIFVFLLFATMTLPSVSSESDIFTSLTDTWGESVEDCRTNPHHISFEPVDDGMIMRLEYETVGAATPGDVRESFVYDVKGYNEHVIVAQLRGENRMDIRGDPVEWRLILFNKNAFCWHREDWEAEQCTVPRVRCEAAFALEGSDEGE